MIRKAKLSEIPVILNLTRACAKHMIKNGIYQWNDHYPSREAFEEDIKRDELFIVVKDENILGTIVISDLKDEIYEPVNWLTSAAACLSICFAVAPAIRSDCQLWRID